VKAESTTATIDDAVLVERFRGGDVSALTALVEKYQDRIYNTCWRLSGNADDAADLTQEAFIKVMEAIGSFGHRSGFYTWLFRIAVNLTLSHRRKSGRRRTLSMHSDGSDNATAPEQWLESADDTPDKAAEDAERHELVAEALETLDEEHRTVIVLRDLQSLDYREIAEILDVPTGTIKSRLHRARLALREKLGPSIVSVQPE